MWLLLTNVTDRQTDRRHAIPIPRICTKVHCAVIITIILLIIINMSIYKVLSFSRAPPEPLLVSDEQVRREEGKFSWAPWRLAGPAIAQKILKRVFRMVSFWPEVCMQSIFGPGPDPAGGAYDAPPAPSHWWSRGWSRGASPRFLPLDPSASGSRRILNEVVIGPRNNSFLGPTLALGGPGDETLCVLLHSYWTSCKLSLRLLWFMHEFNFNASVFVHIV